MALEILNYCSQALSSVIATLVGQVSEVFTTSSLIGSYVIFYVTAIVRFVLFAFDTLLSVAKILSEDFMIFLSDVVSIVLIIHDILSHILTFAGEACINLLLYLRYTIVCILMLPVLFYYEVLSAIEMFVLLIVNSADLIKRGLTLIGSSIWAALMFIPYSTAHMVDLIAYSWVKLSCAFYAFLLDIIVTIFYQLTETSIKILNFFFDVPYEACGGLFLGVVLMWVIYKEKQCIKACCFNLYRLQVKVLTMLIQLVKYPCQYMHHRLERFGHVFRREGGLFYSPAEKNLFSGNENDPSASTSIPGDSTNSLQNLKKKLQMELEEKMCSVCQERRKTVIVLPCRHLCMCEECVMVVKRISRKCPLCRRNITKTMGVYL